MRLAFQERNLISYRDPPKRRRAQIQSVAVATKASSYSPQRDRVALPCKTVPEKTREARGAAPTVTPHRCRSSQAGPVRPAPLARPLGKAKVCRSTRRPSRAAQMKRSEAAGWGRSVLTARARGPQVRVQLCRARANLTVPVARSNVDVTQLGAIGEAGHRDKLLRLIGGFGRIRPAS
jgi:hypothetical protein